LYDDGDYTPALVKLGGWLMDGDGDHHRTRLLGFKEYIDATRNEFRCPECSSVLESAVALRSHRSSKWCRKREQMSFRQASQLRNYRRFSAKKMGICRLQVEPVDLFDIDGGRISAVGEFKYLGTLMSNQGGTTSEIFHRIQAASVAYSHLKLLWNSRILSLKLKLRLFSVVIASVLLYNSECWTITHDDLCRLESFYFRCLRHLTRPIRCPGEPANFVDKVSKQTVFDVAKVPTITSLLHDDVYVGWDICFVRILGTMRINAFYTKRSLTLPGGNS